RSGDRAMAISGRTSILRSPTGPRRSPSRSQLISRGCRHAREPSFPVFWKIVVAGPPRPAQPSPNNKQAKARSRRLPRPKPLVLIILDGWGYRAETQGNAIALARKPTYDRLLREYPNTLIHTSGPYVGLPDGQMGNSEVGHL